MKSPMPAAFITASLILTLTACGGGGSTATTSSAIPPAVSSTTPPTASPTAVRTASPTAAPIIAPTIAPTVAPVPGVANTALQSYLPFHSGNTWTFSSGSKIVDEGSGNIACACAVNGYLDEVMDIITPTGTLSGALVFAKGNWPLPGVTGDRITYLVGTLSGNAFSLLFYNFAGTIPGMPAIDDTPTSGETFTLTTAIGSANVTTTINSVGGTQALGAQIIDNVATTNTLLSLIGQSYSFGFAQGVGFTSLGVNGLAPITLTSFSLNPSSTASSQRRVGLTGTLSEARYDPQQNAAVLSGLF